MGKCRFKCSHYFSNTDRKRIFDEFWKSDKHIFYSTTTERSQKVSKGKSRDSRNNFTYKYYLFTANDHIKTRVCKEFYLITLDIRVQRKNKISEESLKFTSQHIKSFPRMPAFPLLSTKDTERIP